MTDRERFERLQGILRAALARMDLLRFSDLDEPFYDAWRESLLAAGATDAEIDGFAASMVTSIVEATPREYPDLREEQIELVAKHLACTDIRVRIGRDDSYVSVEFPSRAKLQ